MCVAIVLPPDVILEEDVYRASFIGNPDGAGFAYYTKDGKPVVEKGYFNFKDFYSNFKFEREANMDKTFLVHFRAGTHGEKSERNCHPFKLANGIMMHNGTIFGLGTDYCADNKKSDTHDLADIIHDLPEDKLEEFAEKAKSMIGYNAVTILTKSGKILQAGNNSGSTKMGAWFSNFGWCNGYERLVAKYNRESSTTQVGGEDITLSNQRGSDEDYAEYLRHGYPGVYGLD